MPSSVQPEPQLWKLAHPVFDDVGDPLHHAPHLDAATRVALGSIGLGDLDAKAIAIGQTDRVRAVDRAVDMADKP
jgi:hypothetical protein